MGAKDRLPILFERTNATSTLRNIEIVDRVGATVGRHPEHHRLRELLQAGHYREAFMMDLKEKINLVVFNKAKIPVAQQDLNFWNGEFKAAVDYAYQTHLITEAEQAQATVLINERTQKWRS